MTRSRVAGVPAALLVLAAAVGASPAAPSRSQAEPFPLARPAPARVELVSELDALRPGAPFHVALRFEVDDGWHVYWRNPGDSGEEPRVAWELPPGFEVGPLQWPAPERIPFAHLVNFGYEHEVLLAAEVRPPADLEPGTEVELAADVTWLVCDDEQCLPGEGAVARTLAVAGEPAADAAARRAIAAARARVPLPAAESGWGLGAARTDGALVVRLEPPALLAAGLRRVELFPYGAGLIENAAEQRLARRAGAWELTVPTPERPPRPFPTSLAGVLVIETDADGDVEPRRLALAFDAPWSTPGGGEGAGAGGGAAGGGLWLALVGAFVGGLLLNLMPCVLPVLSLKVMSFVRSASDGHRAAVVDAACFAAGVVVSFWAVAGVLLALRGIGQELGWGFQLQSPGFVLALIVLFFLMALSFFGVFEVDTSLTSASGRLQGRSGLVGAFASGVVATVVATPCTAPFMGTALGVALSGSAARALAVFTSLGVGMATPYVLLASYPPLLRRVPRPGPWMVRLKEGLGFLLLATVAWLAWIYGRLETARGEAVGVDGLALLLGGLVAVGLAAWAWGRAASAEPGRGRWLGRGVAALALAAGVGVPLRWVGRPPSEVEWRPFSPELVAELEREGRPYFIDFTAAWCNVCQVNKLLALETAAVEERFAERGIVALRADWTNRDDVIARALEGYGRYSVPLYVYHPGGTGIRPVILPEVLSKSIVLDALGPRDERIAAAGAEPDLPRASFPKDRLEQP